jgi:hypothetical protein
VIDAPCDACGEDLGDDWTALEAFSATPVIVCRTCWPIVAELDRAVARGELDEHQASDRFNELRWGSHAVRGALGIEGGAPDVRDLRLRDVVVSPPTPAVDAGELIEIGF